MAKYLIYLHKMVPRGGIEPPTRRFSIYVASKAAYFGIVQIKAWKGPVSEVTHNLVIDQISAHTKSIYAGP